METNNIKVSIPLLSYKHAKYIRQCLESILAQKVNFKYEIIVGDDCSEDGTKEILLEYKSKYPEIFTLVLNEKNQGASRNGYNIIKLCKGEYISGGECDDFWIDDHRLQKQVDFLDSNPEYVAVFSNYVNVDPDGKKPYVAMLRWQVNKKYDLAKFLHYGMVLHGNTCMRRNIFPREGEKYEKLRLSAPAMGDVILRTLLYDKGPVFCLPDIMHAHRDGSVDKTSYISNQVDKAIEYCYMYCNIVKALEAYFSGKYKLEALIANRTGGVLFKTVIGKYKLDKAKTKEYLGSLPLHTRILSYERVFQKSARTMVQLIGRKLNLFYKL